MTTFTQLTARLTNFLIDWLLVFGLEEGLVECATLCIKSWVILMLPIVNCSTSMSLSSSMLLLKNVRQKQIMSNHLSNLLHTLISRVFSIAFQYCRTRKFSADFSVKTSWEVHRIVVCIVLYFLFSFTYLTQEWFRIHFRNQTG